MKNNKYPILFEEYFTYYDEELFWLITKGHHLYADILTSATDYCKQKQPNYMPSSDISGFKQMYANLVPHITYNPLNQQVSAICSSTIGEIACIYEPTTEYEMRYYFHDTPAKGRFPITVIHLINKENIK